MQRQLAFGSATCDTRIINSLFPVRRLLMRVWCAKPMTEIGTVDITNYIDAALPGPAEHRAVRIPAKDESNVFILCRWAS